MIEIISWVFVRIGEMMNTLDSYRSMLDRNLPLKISFWAFLSLLSLSIIFSIVYAVIGCGGYGFDMPCSFYFTENLTQCRISSRDYCCGAFGSVSCGGNSNCEQMPTPLSVPKCAGVLITSWVLEVFTIIAIGIFSWLCCKARNAMFRGDNYGRMENTEIQVLQGNGTNNAFGGQGVRLN